MSVHHYSPTSIIPRKSIYSTLDKRWRILLISLLVIFITTIATIIGWAYSSGLLHVDFTRTELLKYYQLRDNTVVLDKAGNIISEYYSEYHKYVKPADMPSLMVKAVIATEDRSFFKHRGIDVKAIIRAAVSNTFKGGGKPSQGASTITQQLVRNFLLTKDKTFARKAREALFSIYLETQVPKSRILELYLNSMYLGNRSYGVGSAAYNYFGKPIYALNLAEIAFIAGLFQAPQRYNPFKNGDLGKKRQLYVLRAMFDEGYISQDEYRTYAKKKLEFFRGVKHPKKAPYFVDYTLSEAERLLPHFHTLKDKGLRIFTTLDLGMQEKAENILVKNNRTINSFLVNPSGQESSQEQDHAIEAALVLSQVDSGAINAMVGGRDYAVSQFNRATQARRPPGSAFKPIVYGQALSRGHKWNEVFLISPINISGYKPKNHSSSYLTETTLMRAFYKSINTPAIELANKLGIDNIISFAQNLGIKSPLKNELGTAIGASEVTMMDLLRAYQTIAAKGQKIEPYAIEKIIDGDGKILYQHQRFAPSQDVAMDLTTSFLLREGLRNVFRYGTASNFQYMNKYAAGKTGTTNDSRDTWFCGFTPDYVAISWVGIDGSARISKKASGANLALPIWAELINAVKSSSTFDDEGIPEGVTEVNIDPLHGYVSQNGIPMWFRENMTPDKNDLSAYRNLDAPNANRSIFSR